VNDRNSVRCLLLALSVAALGSTSVKAEDPSPTVGISHRIADLILPGSELTTKPIDDQSPIVVRIDNSRIHGTDFRYDIVYYGLEPGEFDLRDSLARIDGTSTADLPSIPVRIDTLLGKGQVVPNELGQQAAPRIGGYRTALWGVGAIWLIGLLALIFYPRSRNERAAAAQAQPTTLADQLRPYIESAGRGDLSDHDKAELERLLLAYWHDELQVGDLPPAQAIAKLRADEKAGQLFTTLERWLHSPDPIDVPEAEISDLLRPYQDAAASS